MFFDSCEILGSQKQEPVRMSVSRGQTDVSSKHSECVMCRSWRFPVREKKGYGVKIASFLSMMFLSLNI